MKSFFTKEDEILKWDTTETKKILDTAVFEVTKDHNISKTGVEGDYVVLNAKDWVITIPVYNDKFVLVKQWRHGEKKLSVEFPGGVMDPGENPETTAKRELEEETGFKANKLTKLGTVNPNPALFSNHVHFFLAEELIPTGIQHLDHDEAINCIELSEDELFECVGSEEFPHALMLSALALYLKQKRTAR